MKKRCELCETELAETGPPIWEAYCPNEECDAERGRIREAVARIMEERERAQYERLKEKYEQSVRDERTSGDDLEPEDKP